MILKTNSNYKYSGWTLLPPKYIGINKIITQAQFEYMQSNSTFYVVYGDFDTADIDRTESKPLSFDNEITLWGLDTNKTYRYRFMTIINDTTYVSDLGKVKTLIAPYIRTLHTTNITETTATCHGQIDSRGADLLYYFDYYLVDFPNTTFLQTSSLPLINSFVQFEITRLLGEHNYFCRIGTKENGTEKYYNGERIFFNTC